MNKSAYMGGLQAMGAWLTLESSRVTNPGFLPMGVVLILFSASVIAARARLDIAGTILSSKTDCPDPARPNYRCITTYKILPDGAHEPVEYWTAGSDPSLKQRLPVGTKLIKKKWSMAYTVNGKVINDFPLIIYSIGGLIGACCIVLGAIGANREFRAWWAEASNGSGGGA